MMVTQLNLEKDWHSTRFEKNKVGLLRLCLGHGPKVGAWDCVWTSTIRDGYTD